ncbi:MAG: hypothetical protein QXV17_08375 [Candidatus Micrarchaeaceae archaeon]
MRISKDDAKVIRRGYFPPVLKDSPYLEGILKRSIRNGIIRALGANKQNDGKKPGLNVVGAY